MRILLDTCVYGGIVQNVRSAGHVDDVLIVQGASCGCSEDQILVLISPSPTVSFSST